MDKEVYAIMNANALIPQESLVSMCRKLLALCGGRLSQTEAFDVVAPKASFFYARYLPKTACDDAVIDAILADAAANGGPGLLGFTAEAVGADWNGALERRGFMKLAEQAGMMLALDGYTPRAGDARVQRIDGGRLEEWSRVCELSFPKPSELPALRYWIDDADCEFYAWLEGGRILGTLLGFAEAGNYGIHEVSTLPDYRCRGICSALVHHALASAKDAGCRCASLQASPAGAGVYERCGFQIVSTMPSWILPH